MSFMEARVTWVSTNESVLQQPPWLTILSEQATPVRADLLGAHVQAYVNLLPAINTLRLCHRFGKGQNVMVSRLPNEIIGCVEECLMEFERVKLRGTWAKELKCWEACCKAMDHFEEQGWRDTYHQYAYEMELDMSAEDVPLDELSEKQLESLNASLQHCGLLWHDKHVLNKQDWQEKVGRPTERGRGYFSKYSKLIVEHFGLEPWISHTVLRQPKTGQRTCEDIYTTTAAYLTLADCIKTESELSRRRFEEDEYWEEMSAYQPTETALGFSVKGPNQLSKKTVNRFRRATKILNLESLDRQEEHKTLFVRESDVKECDATDKLCSTLQSTEKDGSLPELMFLIRNNDVPDEY